MPDPFAFDYEFTFIDRFDPNVFNSTDNEPTGTPSHDTKELEVISLMEAITNIITQHNGIRKFTSILVYNGIRYRINVINSDFGV
jgi:Ni,Fe-hydrogenase III large subunit